LGSLKGKHANKPDGVAGLNWLRATFAETVKVRSFTFDLNGIPGKDTPRQDNETLKFQKA
jgi:hypothetical protein